MKNIRRSIYRGSLNSESYLLRRTSVENKKESNSKHPEKDVRVVVEE